MKRALLFFAVCWAAGVQVAPPVAAAGSTHAHEHGVARLDVAVQPGRISLTLASALDTWVGFERTPRTAAERDSVEAARRQLENANALWKVDAAAACSAGSAALEAALWQPRAGGEARPGAAGQAQRASPPAQREPHSASAHPSPDSHGDLEVQYQLDCKAAPAAAWIDAAALFAGFPRLQRLQVQVVTPRGQSAVVLRRGQTRIQLQR
jgi:Protein of unknown function (DUF2796)